MTADSEHRLPSAASVLRRALLVWGLGHLSVGDRRGWLLVLLQPLAIGATAGLALLLMDSTRWIVVFPALAILIVAWLAQAIHAHQQALHRGARPGGEVHIAWAMPAIVAVVTAFWLFGGDHGSPAATLQEYVAAWHTGRVEAAGGLFAEPPAEPALAATWQAQAEYIRQRVEEAAERYGPASGLDPSQPFTGLRYLELTELATPDSTIVAVDIVRRQRIETQLFGIVPTATQETVLVERAGTIRLRAVPASWPSWLPTNQPAPRVWRIEEVVLPVRSQ